MGFNEAIEIKANRELIKSIFKPVKELYAEILSEDNVRGFESIFNKEKVSYITFEDDRVTVSVDNRVKKPHKLSASEITYLGEMCGLFNIVEFLAEAVPDKQIKKNGVVGRYVNIGKSYYIISEQITLDEYTYMYAVTPISEIKNRKPIRIKPVKLIKKGTEVTFS